MEDILKELSTRIPHPLNPVLGRYERAAVAARLEISPGYLYDVLTGRMIPSVKLQKRMSVLADMVLAAEGDN